MMRSETDAVSSYSGLISSESSHEKREIASVDCEKKEFD